MKHFQRILGVAILCATTVVLSTGEFANAGRVGGPMSQLRTAPAFQSVFFDTAFQAGKPAVVMISGNGATNLDLVVYDSDNHITVGVGIADQKMATVDVYRPGLFRIEVHNLGARDNIFVIRTN